MRCAGPSAVLAALVASGIACDTFQFVGFLHAKQGQRQKQLKQLAGVCPSHLARASLLVIHSLTQSQSQDMKTLAQLFEVLPLLTRALIHRIIPG